MLSANHAFRIYSNALQTAFSIEAKGMSPGQAASNQSDLGPDCCFIGNQSTSESMSRLLQKKLTIKTHLFWNPRS